MKSMITLTALLLASSVAFAAKCPTGTTTIHSCKSTPKAGDNEVASTVYSSIAVCQSDDQTMMVIEAEGNSVVQKAEVIMRAGGTSYVINEAEEGVQFSLNFTAGIRPGSSKTALFSISFVEGQFTGSSTYTCKK